MIYTILDCYTDEPAGLGVPPYLGTYPRYIAGALLLEKHEVFYITIDDLRYWHYYKNKKRENPQKTDIRTYNLTKNVENIGKILEKTDVLVVNIGVQVPGKYLSAVPGTLKEISPAIRDLGCKKILTGPAALGGTQLEGGKRAEHVPDYFDDVIFDFMHTNNFKNSDKYAIAGTEILKQIPWEVMAEIETMKGCIRKSGCSFCTEPIKNLFQSRDQKPIVEEMKALYKHGARHFRLGKQTCMYTYKNYKTAELKKLFEGIKKNVPRLKTLHIDNANPSFVNGPYGKEMTKIIVEHCTPGNVAAFGVETFDESIVKQNNLNTTPEQTYNAVKIINEIGGKRGPNGMHYFLPGLNLIFGLKGESKKTGEENYYWLKKILDDGLLLRRINIRQVAIYEGTAMAETGLKYYRKNKKYYWKWRDQIRRNIDMPMLKRIVPEGTVMKKVRMEVHDGNHTFGRQFGTYPLIVGINDRLPLLKEYNIMVTKHMLRSVTGEVLNQ